MEKLKIVKDKKDKYHFKSKDDRHIDIEHKNKRLKFKMHKWEKEASVEVFLDMVEADTHMFSGNKIEVEDPKKKLRVYPIDVHGGDGGLRFEVVDKVKFSPYILNIPLVCRNTRWSKQLSLAQEDIDAGALRPENVINSHAVYHVTKKNNQYMTGKMFHFYRVKVIDAEGNWAWCDTDVDRHLDPTMLTITAPTEFMENAVYPVTWDPDLGYTAIGGSSILIASEDLSASRRQGSAWTMPAGGTANYLRARLWGDGVVVDCKAFINQKDSGGAGTHGQIATDENLACAIAEHWEEFTLGGEVLTNGVVYILSVIGNDFDLDIEESYYVKYDNNGAVASYFEDQNYAAPENPWVDAPQGTTRDKSIYVNYTLTGWSGKISGVTDPAEIMGVAKADIAEVKGVA